MKKIELLFRFIAKQLKGHKENRGNSIRFKNYYLSVKDDKRNNFAKIFDYSIWRMLVFFTVYSYVYLRTSYMYLSILISSLSFIVVHSIALKGRKRKFENIKKQKRRYIASQRVYNEIMNKTVDEMKEYIKSIFSAIGFDDFKFTEVDQRYILLNSVYKDEKIMILFNIYKNDFDVELKEVKEFIDILSDNKVKKGILVTTSDFTNDSYDYVNNLKKHHGLLLVNKEQLLKIIENSGFFPNDEEIDEIIESKISKREKKWDQYKSAALARNKVKGYIILSIYLVFTAWYTPYTVYYMVVASIILGLALITFVSNIINKTRSEEEDGIDFEKLLNDM